MRVDVIQGEEAIRAMRANWNAVYDADPEAQYFLSYAWLFGTAAGAGRSGFVLAARPHGADTPYSAFLPLRLKIGHDAGGFHNEIGCSGNNTSDYTGLICRPDHEEVAIPALAEKLRQMNWRRFRLSSFAASDKRADLFLGAFGPEVFDTKPMSMVNPDGIDNSICPSTSLPEDWDTYLQTRVSANTRQKIRRFLRQVEGSEDYRFTHTNAQTLERDIALLIQLWTDRWGKRKGRRLAAIQESNRRMLRHAFATNTLFMPALWHGSRGVCVLALFVDRHKQSYNFYIGGRDEAFQGPPSGLVVHAYAIRHAIAHGFTKYDFLRGNEPYKYSFCSHEFRLRSLVLETRDQKNLGDRLDPRSLPAVLRRSTEMWRENNPDDAQQGYDQVLTVAPDNPSALYLRGLLAARLGDHATAAMHFRTLTGLDPDALKPWLRLGHALAARGKWEEVAETYRKALKRNSKLPRAWFLLGRALFNLDRFDEALTAFESALRLKPGYGDAQTGTFRTLRKLGRTTQPPGALRPRGSPGLGRGTGVVVQIRPAPTLPQLSPASARLFEGRKAGSALDSILAASDSARRTRPLIRNLPTR